MPRKLGRRGTSVEREDSGSVETREVRVMEYMQDSIGGIWAYMVVMMVLFFISKKNRQKRRQENRESEGPRGESSQIERLENADRREEKERLEGGRKFVTKRLRKRCFECNSEEHLIISCPKIAKEREDSFRNKKLREELRKEEPKTLGAWDIIDMLCEELRKEKQDGEEFWDTIIKLDEEIRFRKKLEEDLWDKIGELCEEIRNKHQEIARIDKRECFRRKVFPLGDSQLKGKDGGSKMERTFKWIKKKRGLKKPRALKVMETESAKE